MIDLNNLKKNRMGIQEEGTEVTIFAGGCFWA
jgi:hypothetical protein